MTTTLLNPRPVRSRRAPLTLDAIRQAAPSAFATEPYESMSDRYSYIPTVEVILGMMDAGFQPFSAGQSRTRTTGKQAFTKHMIRFRSEGFDGLTKVGDTFPEVVLVNSHDGSSSYKLMAGLFRLVCSNGMIIADSLIGSISVRHTGQVVGEVATASEAIVEHMPKALNAIQEWQQITLSKPAQLAFAEAAHEIRFADSKGKVDTPIQPAQLLHARRYDDTSDDLWSVFNTIQENTIKGGISARRSGTGRRTTARRINGIDQDVRLNKALWTLGERMAELSAQ